MSTQVKEIALSGLSTSPSDYDCDDGNLAHAIGVLHEDGALINANTSAPNLMADLEDMDILYQHANGSYHHFILKDGDNYYWMNVADEFYDDSDTFSALSGVEITKVISVGDSLIFYSADRVYYYRWATGEDGTTSYKALGGAIPDFSLSFGLRAHPYRAKEDMHGSTWSQLYFENYEKNLTSFSTKRFAIRAGVIPDDCREAFTTAVFADVNYFQGKWCTEKGYFSQPFLVRYALRMFDGTLTKHSSPILMMPTTNVNPLVFIMAMDSDSDKSVFCIDTVGLACSLRYYINSTTTDWSDWKDIIQGVEVFISAPIYTYDASKQVESIDIQPIREYQPARNIFFTQTNGNKAYCIPKAEESTNVADSMTTVLEQLATEDRFNIAGTGTSALLAQAAAPAICHEENRFVYAYSTDGDYSGNNFYIEWKYSSESSETADLSGYAPSSRIIVPERSATEIIKDIRNCSNFYHILTLELDDIIDESIQQEKWVDVGIEGNILGTLTDTLETTFGNVTANESMTDDYDSHHTIIPSGASSYNNRLNIFSIKKIYYDGYPATDNYQRIYNSANDTDTWFTGIYSFVYINSNAKQIITQQYTELNMSPHAPTDYYFYPDVNAKKVVQIVVTSNGTTTGYAKRTLALKEHEGLNGAVHFETLEECSTKWEESSAQELAAMQTLAAKSDDYIEDNNLIYTSEAGNPFVFKAANVEQIGDGEIIAMVPAAQALSSGQFGDFPMYAFTSKGIWALYPNDTGGWASKQVISRDVVLGANAILQMDSSVVFATARGLMEINGSKVECISEIFDGYADTFADKYANHMAALVGYPNGDIQWDGDLNTPFKEFLYDCNMHYDYKHQRIIIGNESYPFCFVFGMKDRLWTTIELNVTKAINSYPQAYAMAKDSHHGSNLLIDFTEAGTYDYVGMPKCGFILTRPLKLDAPDVLKTIRKVIARGHLERANVDIVLYGSRDLNNWLIIGNSKGNELVNRHGTPFKYFRVGIITRLQDGESLSGLTIEYEVKQNDKVR